jgi:DNA mismatch endonuclease (patch repair protein)
MRAVKSENTAPEMVVRRAAFALGLRYRLHRKDIAGRPDLYFPGRRAAVFVHGCFWHGHDCARGARMPKANTAYWQAKIAKNQARDQRTLETLRTGNIRTLTIWECETKDKAGLRARLADFFGVIQ